MKLAVEEQCQAQAQAAPPTLRAASGCDDETLEQPQKKRESSKVACNGFRAFRLAMMKKHFESKKDTQLHRVVDGVFIGSFGATLDVSSLQAHNITHIVCAADTLPLLHEDKFKYLRVSVKDNPFESIRHHFRPTNAFIQDAVDRCGAVLIHCLAGVSRSATICIAYLIEMHRLRLQEALERVTTSRPSARPNCGFLTQLQAFDKEIFEREA